MTMIGEAGMFASIAKTPPVTAGQTGAPPVDKAVDVDIAHSQRVHGDVGLDGPAATEWTKLLAATSSLSSCSTKGSSYPGRCF